MEIEVLKEDSKGFEMKILGEDHTFLNLLTTFLNNNKKVAYAAYKIEHPLVGEPKIFFRLKKAAKEEETPIKKIKGVGPKTAAQLEAIGIKTASQLLLNTPEKLAEKSGIAEKLLTKYNSSTGQVRLQGHYQRSARRIISHAWEPKKRSLITFLY
jgi:DNA-directed RNA polymerase subunit L